MKIEYLYVDESFKNILKEHKLSYFNEIRKDNLYIFYFERKGESEESAKALSVIDMLLRQILDNKKYYKINDEAGEYFNKILYPLCNKFERLLRQVLCLCSMSRQDNEALKKCQKFESLSLIEIYNYFFTDKKFSQKVKDDMQERNLTHNDLVGYLLEPENTIWGNLFKDDYSEIPKSFVEIKKYRNDVMHAKSIDYNVFERAKEKLKKVNQQLEEILEQLLSGSILIADDSAQRLSKLIEEVENMELTDEEKAEWLTKKILENLK